MYLSDFDYQVARQIAATDPPVNALIAAAALRSDSENLAAIQSAFPELIADLMDYETGFRKHH